MPNSAEGYESYMVPALFGPCAVNLIQAADPKPGERVLDVGCGTGIVARQVASRLGARGAVTGFDLSPNMLAVAKTAAAREGMAIEWREGSAEQLPFPESSFDLVLCQFALIFFALGSADELRALALSAGFQRIEIEPFCLTARFPNPDAFIAGEIEVDTAAIPSMQHLDARARQGIVSAITADMESPLGEVTYDNHVVIPFHAHILKAWR